MTLALAIVVLPASHARAGRKCHDGYGMGYHVVYGLGFDRYGMSSGGFGMGYPGYFGYGMGIPGYGGGYGRYGGYGVVPGAYNVAPPGPLRVFAGFGSPGISGVGGFYPIYGFGR